jgi:hypothetical protein
LVCSTSYSRFYKSDVPKGPHLHFTLSWPDKGISGWAYPAVLDPLPYIVAPPVGSTVDNSAELAAARAQIVALNADKLALTNTNILLTSENLTLNAESDHLLNENNDLKAIMTGAAAKVDSADGLLEEASASLKAHTEVI